VPEMYNIISIVSMLLTIAGILGGILAFKNGFARTANEVQDRVINALQQEISVLHMRLADLEAENRRLDQVLITLCEALKKRGIVVTIDGNLVTVTDGNTTHSMRIKGAHGGDARLHRIPPEEDQSK
jgi:hypothetical protein